MQWTFYRVLAAPKDIGLPISTACARLLILSVQVRLLIVGPASCILQGCRCDARVLARSLQGAQLGLFSAPRTTDSAQFRRPGPCREKRELGKEPQIGVVFGTPGTTDLRRVQRKLRNKRPRQPFGFKKMHGNQTYPSSLSVLNRRPLLAQTKGRRACLASRRPWITFSLGSDATCRGREEDGAEYVSRGALQPGCTSVCT